MEGADNRNQNVMKNFAKISTQIHEQHLRMLDDCRGTETNV